MMNTEFFAENLRSFMRQIFTESQQLPRPRRTLLDAAAQDVAQVLSEAAPVNLLFVCTHNSRRSQFSQLWAATAVNYFGIEDIRCYSCGTEATACNPRTVESLRRSGVRITTQQLSSPENPI